MKRAENRITCGENMSAVEKGSIKLNPVWRQVSESNLHLSDWRKVLSPLRQLVNSTVEIVVENFWTIIFACKTYDLSTR